MTKIIIVHPHEGVESIRFGMSRAEVAHAMQIAPKRFKRNPFGFEQDFFETLGTFVLYDENDTCNAISIARDLGTDWEYDGYRLLAHPAREVREWALARDPHLELRDGFISKALGLTMGADWIDEPDLDEALLNDPAEAFVAFRPGYYEEEEKRIAALNITHEGWFSPSG